MQGHNRQLGFTLIELMAGIGVAAILMAIAIPVFTRALPGLRLNEAARQIATDLQQTRMRAVAQSMPHQISFASTSYTVQSCNGACADISGAMGLPEGISIAPPLPPPPQFQPRGTVAAASSIKITNGTDNKWVCVKIVGRINIQDSNCS
jgi:prepilin-type N-terminal cleavage/methylation domain-containing protein